MTTETTKTKAEQTNADITALLKARNSLLWITTREELRVERALVEAASAASYTVRYWDCANGITEDTEDGGTKVIERSGDPAACMKVIRDDKKRCVYILRDMHKWFDAITLRSIRSLARSLQTEKLQEARAMVILTPSGEIPPELSGHTTVVDYPIPDRAEMSVILDKVLDALPEHMRKKALAPGDRERAIDAAVGLTSEEASNCYSKSLVTIKRIDPSAVAGEKKRVIAREKVLTWHDPDPRGLDAVGGLDVLKTWLIKRKAAFSPKAKQFGLRAPKGVFLLGVAGCGKSLTAKCVATAWQMPLLQLDMGALKGKFVGESEGNIRKALAVAEAVSPCVLWIDEIEKAMAGATGEQGDGGVSADALGVVLQWMQERKAPVFVIATANDVRSLPPELLRKGRFDDMFFVDLPTSRERNAIAAAALRQVERDPAGFDLDAISAATESFTGAEIAELVPAALFVAFEEDCRALTTDDLVKEASNVSPLAKTASEKIGALREWVKGRARPASTPDAVRSGSVRGLDL